MTRTLRILGFCAAAAGLLASIDASSQMQRRDRGGAPRDSQQREKRDAAPAPAADPISALERELPSLNVDLLLTADQLELWRVFERDVRDVADMDRARRKHVMSLREGGERAPTALVVIAALAEDERMKNDAMSDLKRHLEALYAKLDEKQRLTLDRRMLLSQAEPLGR